MKKMRKLEVVREEIEDMQSRLSIAKENYADIVIEFMDMGGDSTHHTPKAYQKVVMDLTDELNVLLDEHHEILYS